MGFWGKVGFAAILGLVGLKLLAMLSPEPHQIHEVWVGTQCPRGEVVVTSDIDDPALVACKDAQKHQYED